MEDDKSQIFKKNDFKMIAVCTPARDLVHLRFACDLFYLALFADPEALDFIPCEGTVIPNQRSMLVREALRRKASYVLFIDSDMRFPYDLIAKMLRHNKPIVAANCVDKRSGKQTAIVQNGRVISVGCAVMMIERRVFEEISEPWFAMPFDGEKLVGEDRFFCRKASEAGFEIFIDEELSREIRHIGLAEYSIEGEEK
jgi:hypothetical protein